MTFCQNIDYAEIFAKLIAKNLATYDGSPIAQPEQQGNEFYTFFAGENVIRIARDETVRDMIAKEAALLRTLNGRTTSVLVPQLIEAQPENNFMVVDKLPGETLTPERLASLPFETRQKIAADLGAFIADLHRDEHDRRMMREPWYQWDRSLPKTDLALANADNVEDLDRLHKVREYMVHYDRIQDRFTTTHGDLWAGNILYDDATGKVGVIDFADTKPNLAHCDFVTLAHFYPMDFVSDIARSYERASDRRVRMYLVDIARDARYISHRPVENAPFNFKAHLAKPLTFTA